MYVIYNGSVVVAAEAKDLQMYAVCMACNVRCIVIRYALI